MTLYMAVTADKYELPLYVTESAKDMALWAGVTIDGFHSMVSRKKHKTMQSHRGARSKRRLYKVTVEIEEDDLI